MSLKELVAATVHDQWSMWQKHQNKKLGSLEGISGIEWLEWDRKSKTDYLDLTPEEQKSDIEIAEKLWLPLFVSWLNLQRASEGGTDWKSVIDTLIARTNANQQTKEEKE